MASSIFRSLVFILTLAPAISNGAAILNGSFEDGLTGWSQLPTGGSVSAISSLGRDVVRPTDGTSFLYMSNGPGDVGNDGDTDNYGLISEKYVIDSTHAYLSFDFGVLTDSRNFVDHSPQNEKASVSFDGISVGQAIPPSDYLRYRDDDLRTEIWRTLDNTAYDPLDEILVGPSGAGFTHWTGWITATLDVSAFAGNLSEHDLLVRVSDPYGPYVGYDTGIVVDDFRLDGPTEVPIPAASWLFLSGLGVL